MRTTTAHSGKTGTIPHRIAQLSFAAWCMYADYGPLRWRYVTLTLSDTALQRWFSRSVGTFENSTASPSSPTTSSPRFGPFVFTDQFTAAPDAAARLRGDTPRGSAANRARVFCTRMLLSEQPAKHSRVVFDTKAPSLRSRCARRRRTASSSRATRPSRPNASPAWVRAPRPRADARMRGRARVT